MPNIYKTREIALCEIIGGENLIDEIQHAVQSWVWCFYYWVSKICHATDHYTTDEKIKLYRKVINLYENLYENHDHLFGLKRTLMCYEEMAGFLLEDGRVEECIAHLEKAIKYAELCENYDLKCKPTSLLINTMDITNGWRESYKEEKSYLHYKLTTQPRYDSIRETPEFKKILEKLA